MPTGELRLASTGAAPLIANDAFGSIHAHGVNRKRRRQHELIGDLTFCYRRDAAGNLNEPRFLIAT